MTNFSNFLNYFFQGLNDQKCQKYHQEEDGGANPTKSTYAIKLLKENESLKGKLSQIEQNSPVCFHGNCISTPMTGACQQAPQGGPHYQHHHHDTVRASIEQSHTDLQNRQTCLKSQVRKTIFEIYVF
jgi:hypothetical protein